MSDRLDQFLVVDLPPQPLADQLRELAGTGPSFAADANVLVCIGIGRCSGTAVLFAQSEEPAHEELGPALPAAQVWNFGFRCCSARRRSRPHAFSPMEGDTTSVFSLVSRSAERVRPRPPGNQACVARAV